MSQTTFFILLFIAGVIGWLYEWLLDGKPDYMVIGGRTIRVPFNAAYSLGALVWYALWQYSTRRKLTLPTRVMVYAAGITALEWVIGHLSAYVNGRPLWNYAKRKSDPPVYVAVGPTVAWVLFSLGLEVVFSLAKIKI